MSQWQEALAAQAASPSVGERSSVTAAATDTLLLAAGARVGAMIFNDADKDLYLAFGTQAASTNNYSIRIAANGYYETPFEYSGEIRGIWAANPTGAARVTRVGV